VQTVLDEYTVKADGCRVEYGVSADVFDVDSDRRLDTQVPHGVVDVH